jgi:Tol biopolymer transport system component
MSHRRAALCPAIALILGGASCWGASVSETLISVGPNGDRATSQTIASAINGDAHFAAFSGAGFTDDAGSLQARYYLRDISGATTQRNFVDSDRSNVMALRMSDDGRYVAYEMNQGGFEETKVFDRQAGHDLDAGGDRLLWLSHNGRWLVSSAHDRESILIADLVSGAGRTISLDRTGTNADGSWTDVYECGAAVIDDSGRWLVYTSQLTGSPHDGDASGTYLYDLTSQTALRIAADAGTASARDLWITADAHYVAYVTLAETRSTIRVFDRVAGFSHRVSNAGGVVPNADSSMPSITNDGHYVVFASNASDIVANDTNGKADIFRFDRPGQQVMRVTMGTGTAQANGDSYSPSITADGTGVAFISSASNLIDADTNGQPDAFLARIQPDAPAEPSPEPTPAPPAGGGSKPADTGGTTPIGSGGGSSGDGGGHCGFGAGGAVAALVLALGSFRRRGRR